MNGKVDDIFKITEKGFTPSEFIVTEVKPEGYYVSPFNNPYINNPDQKTLIIIQNGEYKVHNSNIDYTINLLQKDDLVIGIRNYIYPPKTYNTRNINKIETDNIDNIEKERVLLGYMMDTIYKLSLLNKEYVDRIYKEEDIVEDIKDFFKHPQEYPDIYLPALNGWKNATENAKKLAGGGFIDFRKFLLSYYLYYVVKSKYRLYDHDANLNFDNISKIDNILQELID